jgi:hypothetical protein
MANMTKREEAQRESEIDAVVAELRAGNGRQLVGSLREQVRQWKESDAFNAWPLDIQFLTKVLSDSIDQIERSTALKILQARKQAQHVTDRPNEHMRVGDVTVKGN